MVHLTADAFENDTSMHRYDNAAIYTGSTTIVDGKPVIVYPGKCTGKQCPTGFTYDVAVPANASDPLFVLCVLSFFSLNQSIT